MIGTTRWRLSVSPLASCETMVIDIAAGSSVISLLCGNPFKPKNIMTVCLIDKINIL